MNNLTTMFNSDSPIHGDIGWTGPGTIGFTQQLQKPTRYFVSGHRDLTEEEFSLHYAPALDKVSSDPNSIFLIGDCKGADILAQTYLLEILEIDPSRVTVFYPYPSPRNISSKVTNIIGGFIDDRDKDTYMTLHSDTDIAFVRNPTQMSGTAENILRRRSFSPTIDKELYKNTQQSNY